MQKAEITTRKRIRKLVREFVRLERQLLRRAFKLKSFYGLRQEIRKEYLDATIRSPEHAADEVWAALVGGDEQADCFDWILMDLPLDAKRFHVADAILTHCKEKGWGKQVQSVMNEDAKQLLAEWRARSKALLKLQGSELALA